MSTCVECDGSGIAPATELTIARMRHLTGTVSPCLPCDGTGSQDRLGAGPGLEATKYPSLPSIETGGGEYGASPPPRAEAP